MAHQSSLVPKHLLSDQLLPFPAHRADKSTGSSTGSSWLRGTPGPSPGGERPMGDELLCFPAFWGQEGTSGVTHTVNASSRRVLWGVVAGTMVQNCPRGTVPA